MDIYLTSVQMLDPMLMTAVIKAKHIELAYILPNWGDWYPKFSIYNNGVHAKWFVNTMKESNDLAELFARIYDERISEAKQLAANCAVIKPNPNNSLASKFFENRSPLRLAIGQSMPEHYKQLTVFKFNGSLNIGMWYTQTVNHALDCLNASIITIDYQCIQNQHILMGLEDQIIRNDPSDSLTIIIHNGIITSSGDQAAVTAHSNLSSENYAQMRLINQQTDLLTATRHKYVIIRSQILMDLTQKKLISGEGIRAIDFFKD